SLASTTGLTFTTGTGTNNATMTFTGTLANVNAALNGLTYTPGSFYNGGDTLQITTLDTGDGKTLSSNVGLTVAGVLPVNTVPVATQNTNENTITIADVDANGASEQITLIVTHGTLSLASTTGLTFTTGTGSNNSTMTFTGTLANVNAALNGLTYNPGSFYNGTDSLQITTLDTGNSKTLSSTVGLNVT